MQTDKQSLTVYICVCDCLCVWVSVIIKLCFPSVYVFALPEVHLSIWWSYKFRQHTSCTFLNYVHLKCFHMCCAIFFVGQVLSSGSPKPVGARVPA